MGGSKSKWMQSLDPSARYLGTDHSVSVSPLKRLACTAREDPSIRTQSSQKAPSLSMAGFIVLLPISLLASGAIILTLTLNIVHSPPSYLIRLHTEDTIVIYLVICITTVYYALITSFRQPQSLIDGLVEPPMIPSWVPWVGSGFDYFAHPLTFFKKYRYKEILLLPSLKC